MLLLVLFLEYLVLLHPLRLFGVVIESLNDFVGEGSCMAEVLFLCMPGFNGGGSGGNSSESASMNDFCDHIHLQLHQQGAEVSHRIYGVWCSISIYAMNR